MHWTEKMLDVYVGTNDQERCLWEWLNEGSVHGPGRRIEVRCAWICITGVCDDQERCMQDLIAVRGACKL
jgi:hypothetical protein